MPETEKPAVNCFVVIGFGVKTDPLTGRKIDLDRTFRELIEPACNRVGVRCFRAVEVNRTGSIDLLMYKWLYEADLVIADLTTLNPNVFYEIGVRCAQRPKTTILMAESGLLDKCPFDLSHTNIRKYKLPEEDGTGASTEEFVTGLADLIQDLLENPAEDPDSPVYTYLRDMKPPEFRADRDFERRVAEAGDEPPLIEILQAAERAAQAGDYDSAVAGYERAVELRPTDHHLRRQLALATYKQKEGEATEVAVAALKKAEQILDYCKLETSTDPETLNLAGDINQELYNRTDDQDYLDRAIDFYERAFHIEQGSTEYGLEAAMMHTIKANLTDNDFDAITHYGRANQIREEVVERSRGRLERKPDLPAAEKKELHRLQAVAFTGMWFHAQAADALRKGGLDEAAFHSENRRLEQEMRTFRERLRTFHPDWEWRWVPERQKPRRSWGWVALLLIPLAFLLAAFLLPGLLPPIALNVEVAPITDGLETINSNLSSIDQRLARFEAPGIPGVNLETLEETLTRVSEELNSVNRSLGTLQPPVSVDVRNQLEAINRTLATLRPVMGGDVTAQLEAIDQTLAVLSPRVSVDLGDLENQLRDIRTTIRDLRPSVSVEQGQVASAIRALELRLEQIVNNLEGCLRSAASGPGARPQTTEGPSIQFRSLEPGLQAGFEYRFRPGQARHIDELGLILQLEPGGSVDMYDFQVTDDRYGDRHPRERPKPVSVEEAEKLWDGQRNQCGFYRDNDRTRPLEAIDCSNSEQDRFPVLCFDHDAYDFEIRLCRNPAGQDWVAEVRRLFPRQPR